MRRFTINLRAKFDLMRALGVHGALFFMFVATICAVKPKIAHAADVRVPLTIDYLALREAIKHQMYTGPDGRAPLWNGPDICEFLYATDPAFSRAPAALKFETNASLALGLSVRGKCVSPIKWQGIIEAETAPYIETGLQLKFHVKDLNLLDEHHKKSLVVGKGFDLIKRYFIPRLESFTFDLNPAVQQLSALAEAASTPDVAERISTAMASIHSEPGVAATPDGVRITLVITVPDEGGTVASATPVPLTPEEIAAFEKLLDQWDAFLVFAVKQMGGVTGDEQFRSDILRILLDSRFRLVQAISNPPVTAGSDPVRALFIDEWSQLHDAVKGAAARGTLGTRGLELMSFISAGDALFALDQAAPALGMRISADDLRRLAHILAPSATGDPLVYDYNEDPDLKKMFGVTEPPELPGKIEESDAPVPLPEASGSTTSTATPTASAAASISITAPPVTASPIPTTPPSPAVAASPTPPPSAPPSMTPTATIAPPATASPLPLQTSPTQSVTPATSSWLDWPIRMLSPAEAYAAEPGILGELENVAHVLRRAVVDAQNAATYRADMGRLLDLSADRQFALDEADPRFHPLYKNLVLSAAWQESCWRQFILVDGRVRWLESSTGDIGLMQVNKRVWRGFYNIDRLKWDVLYNAGAGSEILGRMMDAAVSSGGRTPSGDSLARSAYAAYNGGPGALHRWLRHEPPEQRAIDNAFWQKYQAVKSGQSIDIMSCVESWGHSPGHQ